MLLFIRGVLLVLAIVLLLDSVILFSQLKFNVGTLVPFFIGLIFLMHALYWQTIAQFRHNPSGAITHQSPYILQTLAKFNVNGLWFGAWGMFFIWLVSFIIFAVMLKQKIDQAHTDSSQTLAYHSYQSSNQSSNQPIQAIIVLGSGTKAGQPSATLAKRLDTAAQLAQYQPAALVLVSGGVDIGETQSEAAVMANYLMATHHLPESRLALEEQSSSTEANLANSKAILAQRHIDVTLPNPARVAIVTSDFHTLRSHRIATKQGYASVQMVASDTPLPIRYNAWLREYFAFASGWILREY